MNPKRLRRAGRLALVVLAVSTAQGCVYFPPFHSGAPVPQARVAALRPGTTTKYELLESFGMPLSIARKGETLLIARGMDHAAGGVTPAHFEYLSADAFFEPFADRATGAQHRVYYYSHTISSKHAVVITAYLKESVTRRSEDLWVLVNEQTGLVEDFLFHPAR